MKTNITAIRRVRKSDNNRIARAVGVTIIKWVKDVREPDVGTKCRNAASSIEKIGDEFFTFLMEYKQPKACTALLRKRE